MNIVFIGKKRGVDTLMFGVSAVDSLVAETLRSAPGIGKPFLVFGSFPDGRPASVNFDDAPVVSSDIAANQAAIDDMLANPRWDALIY